MLPCLHGDCSVSGEEGGHLVYQVFQFLDDLFVSVGIFLVESVNGFVDQQMNFFQFFLQFQYGFGHRVVANHVKHRYTQNSNIAIQAITDKIRTIYPVWTQMVNIGFSLRLGGVSRSGSFSVGG